MTTVKIKLKTGYRFSMACFFVQFVEKGVDITICSSIL